MEKSNLREYQKEAIKDALKGEIDDVLTKYEHEDIEQIDEHRWTEISRSEKLSIYFIEKFQDEVNWHYISSCQDLPEDFIEKFKDEVDWHQISIRQVLSEDFIKKHQDEVDWEDISIHQNLSEDFMMEFKDKLNWEVLTSINIFSENFMKKINDDPDIHIGLSSLVLNIDNEKLIYFLLDQYKKHQQDTVKRTVVLDKIVGKCEIKPNIYRRFINYIRNIGKVKF